MTQSTNVLGRTPMTTWPVAVPIQNHEWEVIMKSESTIITLRGSLAKAGAGFSGVILSLAMMSTPLAAERTETFVYSCDGEDQSIVVTITGDSGHLFAAQTSQRIERKSGAIDFHGEDIHYQPDNPPDLAPGQTATMTIKGQKLENCKNDTRAAVWEAAKLRGVSYRAIGQEPGWQLEIYTGEEFRLVTDNGQKKLSLPYAEPQVDQAQRTTRYSSTGEAGNLGITITGEKCIDSMSGEKYASKVEVTWADNTLRGCGRALH
jgi:uncharacterized membrane protein